MEVAEVEEVVDPLLAAVVRLRLRDLVVVVRELQIVPARVNVHAVSYTHLTLPTKRIV